MTEQSKSNLVEFRLPVTVQKVDMRADRSVAVHVRTTQEIPEHQFTEVHRAFQRVGWFIFSENEINEEDVPKEDAPNDTKSATQRLFNVLFVMYKLEAEAAAIEGFSSHEEFEPFRQRNMNIFIDWVKDRIAELEQKLGRR